MLLCALISLLAIMNTMLFYNQVGAIIDVLYTWVHYVHKEAKN
jgi:hypothetical protein